MRIMKFLSFICLLSLSSAVKIDTQDNKASRRLSYSTNVVHEDPKHPHHAQASSSINFKLTTSEEAESNSAPSYNNYSPTKLYTTPKTAQEYPSQEDYSEYKFPAVTSTQSYLPKPTYDTIQYSKSANPTNIKSFNVGYSMSFTNNKEVQPVRYATDDVITGSRKEAVGRPTTNSNVMTSFIGEDFVRNSLIDTKKQKISGIKSKYPKSPLVNVNTKQLLAQANLSPKTQKQLAYLETAKNIGTKFPTEGRSHSSTSSSPWRNLSPTVEIYHSKELSPTFSHQEARTFDHSRALGKSEGFDQSNAVDMSNMHTSKISSAPAFESRTVSYFKPDLNLNNYGGDSKSNRYLSTQYNKQSIPKLPIDTSLLRDPFLTTEKLSASPGSKTIPIHFDTTLIQEMNKQIVNSNIAPHYDTSLESDATSQANGAIAYKLNYKIPSDLASSNSESLSAKHAENYNKAYASALSGQHSNIAPSHYEQPSYYQSPSALSSSSSTRTVKSKPSQYGFQPPRDNLKVTNTETAQSFGFEAPRQIFAGQNNQQINLKLPPLANINAQQTDERNPTNPYYFKNTNDYSNYNVGKAGFDTYRDSSIDHYNIQQAKYNNKESIRDQYHNEQQSSKTPEAYLTASEQHTSTESEEDLASKQKEYHNYPSNYYNYGKTIRQEYVPDPDPMKEVNNKYKEMVNSKDYDFQKEFDKILYSSSIKSESDHKNSQLRTAMNMQSEYQNALSAISNTNQDNDYQKVIATKQPPLYKGPTSSTNSHNHNNNYNKFNRYNNNNSNANKHVPHNSHSHQSQHMSSSHNQKRENSPQQYPQQHQQQHHQQQQQQNPRQTRIKYKNANPRVVREYIDTDLKPPPMVSTKHRRMQTANFNQMH